MESLQRFYNSSEIPQTDFPNSIRDYRPILPWPYTYTIYQSGPYISSQDRYNCTNCETNERFYMSRLTQIYPKENQDYSERDDRYFDIINRTCTGEKRRNSIEERRNSKKKRRVFKKKRRYFRDVRKDSIEKRRDPREERRHSIDKRRDSREKKRNSVDQRYENNVHTNAKDCIEVDERNSRSRDLRTRNLHKKLNSQTKFHDSKTTLEKLKSDLSKDYRSIKTVCSTNED